MRRKRISHMSICAKASKLNLHRSRICNPHHRSIVLIPHNVQPALRHSSAASFLFVTNDTRSYRVIGSKYQRCRAFVKYQWSNEKDRRFGPFNVYSICPVYLIVFINRVLRRDVLRLALVHVEWRLLSGTSLTQTLDKLYQMHGNHAEGRVQPQSFAASVSKGWALKAFRFSNRFCAATRTEGAREME